MEQLLGGMDITQLSYGALFVWLLMDTNKKNKEREDKYQATIDLLVSKVGIIEEVKNDVDEIKVIIKGGMLNE